MLRQKQERPAGKPQRCLADFIAPVESRRLDFLGAFAVTAGTWAEKYAGRFEADLDDYRSILVKALADRLAEAFAEFLHREARQAWGYGLAENLSVPELTREKFRGIRPAAGYPACPDHSEKRFLVQILQAERHTGISLTESCAMLPASSVSGLNFSHPQSRYFAVGKVAADQLADYARRKGVTVEEAARWLTPYLD